MRHPARLATFVAFVTLAAGSFGSSPARAQTADTLRAERAQLRAQLDKVNAEIDALKRAGRGVRDDYRLRARLADAESLARRLIDIEARLGIRVDGAAKVGPPPIASPTDGPADLDAKADILADQARRIRAQADALGRRAADAKTRQELRRRAADLDRDPFAPMEGSKRRIASSAGGAVVPAAAPGPTRDGAPAVAGATPNKNDSLPPIGPTPPTQATNATAAPLSEQLRDVLDRATLTDIRRLETTATAGGSPQALERAAAALRSRADGLEAQSRAMRAKAQAK